MEFRQLRYFIAVAEELHFGRAAKRLQISRPPLSQQQILALERELGVELLIRGRSIELTEAGRVLLEHGRSASEAVTYAVQAAREAGEGMTRLRVGYPAGAASASVPLAVRIFRERFPPVALDTVVGQAGAHLAALAARQLDVAFVRLAGANGDNLAFRPLHREPVHVAIPELHPLARLRAVRAGHLANEPIVLFPRRSTRRSTTTWCTTSWPAAVSRRRSCSRRPRWRAAWSRSPAGWGSLSRPSRRPDSSPSAGSSSAPWSRWPRRCSSA